MSALGLAVLMRNRRSILLAAAIFASAFPARASADGCVFPSSPTVVLDDGKRLLQFWEADDSELWRSGLLPDSAEYWRFVQYVRARLDVSDLDRYLSVAAAPTAPDKRNARLMLTGKTGEIRPINCLEALLFSVQAGRHPMETRPTEFLSFMLRRGDGAGRRLKIWFYTVDEPGIGRTGPLNEPVEADIAAGWRPYLNLHNHNFFFDQTPVVGGAPWPSANDLQLMKNLSFDGVVFELNAVTNGFVTSHIRPGELKRFQAAGEP